MSIPAMLALLADILLVGICLRICFRALPAGARINTRAAEDALPDTTRVLSTATAAGSLRSGPPQSPRGSERSDAPAGSFLFLPVDQSAYTTLITWQRLAIALTAVLIVTGFVLRPLAMLIALNGVVVAAYLLVILFRFYTVYRGERLTSSTPKTLSAAVLNDADLPVYTLLCPLYKEAGTVGQFIDAVCKLNYPTEKLDIRILLEEDDIETQAAARAAKARSAYPDSIEIVVVPDTQPKTKPKACNYGLLSARGEYVVIYDAEDLPEPDQLRLVLDTFHRLPESVVCVQARLNYFNPRQNLLTRFFTAEYSMWFDLFLPGLFAVGSPIPLGGTSNHFKKDRLLALGAWDPFNVTEDADLGVRIAGQGYRTAIVDSTTWEEANSRVGNWIRQRSRWVKGYMQVWLVAMRHPVALMRTLGPWRFFCFHATVGGTPFVLLLNPLYWVLTALYLLTAWDIVPKMFPTPVLVLSLLSGLLGNLAFIYLSIFGLFKREHYGLVPLMFLSPVYWVLQSIAAWKGFYQLVTKPHFWEKTQHNLAAAGAVATPATASAEGSAGGGS